MAGPGLADEGRIGRVDSGKVIVETTGARYTLRPREQHDLAEQRIEHARPVAVWKSRSPWTDLKVLQRTETECIVANDNMTFGIQCDSLMMVVPHEELVLICESQIDGRWNRMACGHMLIVDDLGGFAVNPRFRSVAGDWLACIWAKKAGMALSRADARRARSTLPTLRTTKRF